VKNVKRQETENVTWDVICLPSLGSGKSCGPVFPRPWHNVPAFSRCLKGSSVYFHRVSKTHVFNTRRDWQHNFGESSCGHLPAWEVTVKITTPLIAHGRRRAIAEMQQMATRS
jgi:hypothetical protein